MIYVFRPQASESAQQLATQLDGRRFQRPENLLRLARPGDKTIFWGAHVPGFTGRSLNNVPIQSKLRDALRLREADVRTVEVRETRPAATQAAAPPVDPLVELWEDAQASAEDFLELAPMRDRPARELMQQFVQQLTQVLQVMNVPAPPRPAPEPPAEWIPRANDHVGGNDLLRQPARPDFWVKKEQIVREFRIHSFLGRTVRAGVKVHRTADAVTPFTGTPHPWIRSWDGGWTLSYADDIGITQAHRDIAHKAVRALGLDFGAVDIGELADGTLLVLEVNRAPGLDGTTPEKYEAAIRRWISGEWMWENSPFLTQRVGRAATRR